MEVVVCADGFELTVDSASLVELVVKLAPLVSTVGLLVGVNWRDETISLTCSSVLVGVTA